MAANNAAAHQVFAIPERLEHNLTYLDILELLRCQQVCNTFLTTTFASPKLQKRLTYRALASSTLSHKHAKPIYNPLFYNFQGIWANYHDMRSSGKSREWVLRRHVQSEEKMPPVVTEGSWRSMLVSQPPVKRQCTWSASMGRRGGIGCRRHSCLR